VSVATPLAGWGMGCCEAFSACFLFERTFALRSTIKIFNLYFLLEKNG